MLGWYPRPVPPADCSVRHQIFKHPQGLHGIGIMGEIGMVPLTERGKRRCWEYEVTFEDGEKIYEVIECPSVPFHLSRDDAAIMMRCLGAQPYNGPLMDAEFRTKKLQNIKTLLEKRNDEIEHFAEWEELFLHSLPPIDKPAETFNQRVYGAVPFLLFQEAHGPIQVPPPYVAPPETSPDSIVDPVTWRGGPVTYAERKRLLEENGLWKGRKKRGDDGGNGGDKHRKKKHDKQAQHGKSKNKHSLRRPKGKKKEIVEESTVSEQPDNVEDVVQGDDEDSVVHGSEDMGSIDAQDDDDRSSDGLEDSGDDSSVEEKKEQEEEDDKDSAPTFNVGDKIVNCHRLLGEVVGCNEDGTYSVVYTNGKKDPTLHPSNFSLFEPRVRKKNSVSKKGRWVVEEVPHSIVWGAEATQLEGKRKRNVVDYSEVKARKKQK